MQIIDLLAVTQYLLYLCTVKTVGEDFSQESLNA